MFDLSRFLRLARAQWAEYRRTYAWFLGIGIIVHFVLLLVLLSGNRGYTLLTVDGQAAFYFVGLFLTAPLFAARYFQAMARRESAGLLLMHPASKFEKWLLAMAVVAVLYPVAYSLAFYVCNAPAALYAESAAAFDAAMRAKEGAAARADSMAWETYGLFLPWSEFESWRSAVALALVLTSLQAFAVLGSLYFRSFPAVKTVVVAFVLMLFLMLVETIGGGQTALFKGYWTHSRELVAWQQWFFPVAWFAIPALLWLASLFALGEREVA